jgi:hypothetical protein
VADTRLESLAVELWASGDPDDSGGAEKRVSGLGSFQIYARQSYMSSVDYSSDMKYIVYGE